MNSVADGHHSQKVHYSNRIPDNTIFRLIHTAFTITCHLKKKKLRIVRRNKEPMKMGKIYILLQLCLHVEEIQHNSRGNTWTRMGSITWYYIVFLQCFLLLLILHFKKSITITLPSITLYQLVSKNKMKFDVFFLNHWQSMSCLYRLQHHIGTIRKSSRQFLNSLNGTIFQFYFKIYTRGLCEARSP